MPQERVETPGVDHITVGEARRIGFSNPRVAQICRTIQNSWRPMESDRVTKLMRRKGYKGWRALNMLVLSHDLSFFSDTGELFSWVNKLNPNRYEDTSSYFNDKDSLSGSRGQAIMSGHSWIVLSHLAKNKHLSPEELEKLNGIGAKNWMSTFNLVNAGWAKDTAEGLTLTDDGQEAAIDLSIAAGYEEESAKRELKRTLRRKIVEGEEEVLKLKGNLCGLAAQKAKEEIRQGNITPESLEEIDPSKLRDVVVNSLLKELYNQVVRVDHDSRKYYFAQIKALKEIQTFSTPHEFESKLEDLGRQKYQLIKDGNPDTTTVDRQIEIIEQIYDCLKFTYQIPPYKYSALLTLQQEFHIPFWSDNWRFSTGMNYAYKTSHNADSPAEHKVTVGTIVRLRPRDGIDDPNDPLFAKEFEVVDVQQGLFSAIGAHYQHVYMKDNENWIRGNYLANVIPVN